MNGLNFDATKSYSKAEPPLGSEHYLERLCELAARDQWKLGDLAWDSLDVHTLPEVAVCRQLIDDLNLRLAQVGLDTRIAPWKAAT